jgi:hypothetical protein
LDCSFVSFSPPQTLVELTSKLRHRGGEKRSVLSTRPSGRSTIVERLMLVIPTSGQHGPGDASQFVGDRDHDFVAWSPLG